MVAYIGLENWGLKMTNEKTQLMMFAAIVLAALGFSGLASWLI
jgi:hypothetical protein